MYNVVFFGTPDFSVSSLKTLNELSDFNIKAVVTMPDRKSGRGQKLTPPPVAVYAKENELNLIQTENINKEIELLNNLEIDFFVVIAFAQFLGSKLLSLPKYGAFNIHTSLLPKYRGAAPIQYALLNGDEYTGVCIQKMVKKMDAGDICYQHKVAITPEETSGSLFKKLEAEAAKGLKNFLINFSACNGDIEYTKQDESQVSFAPTISKNDGLINPFADNQEQIINKSRAYSPWPGLFIFFNGHRVKVHKVSKYDLDLGAGEINTEYGALILGSRNGSLRLEEVQPEGKKTISDKDFLNGFKSRNEILVLDKDHYE